MKPLVSIGMAIFNCESTLGAAIRSILNQTYWNWELILIDDGSQDQTLLVAESFKDSRIRLVADGLHMHLASRLNQAIAMSKGKYFARMDGDDIAYPERLQIQVDYLENHPDIDLIGTKMILFGREGQAIGSTTVKQSHSEICCNPWAGFYLSHPTWMGKTEWFRTYQYQPRAIRAQDQELLLRTYKNSQFATIPDILLGYRQESLSLEKSLKGRYDFSRALLEQAFAQRDYLLTLGVAEQAVKALVDTVAIATGLNFKLLRHRAGHPLNTAELLRWQEVWFRCSSEEVGWGSAVEH